MARSLSANVGLAVAREASLGVLPGSPLWLTLQPNGVGKSGAELTTITRQPWSKNRMEEKGEVVDLDSGFTFDADLTMDAFVEFMEAFVMATYTGPAVFSVQSTNPVTAVTATDYTVGSGGALATDTLIHAKGFLTAANNGLKEVTGGSTATAIKAAGLVAETVPADGSRNVSVEVAGRKGASGDIVMTAGGNLTATALNFTTLNLTVGQFIKIGGTAAGTQFATAANNGYARIVAIAAGQLTLDWRSGTFVSDPGAGKTIYLLFGQFLRNVPADHANSLMGRSYAFELAYEDLSAPGVDAYEYPAGNVANEVSFNLPLTEKSTVSWGFVGTDTANPTTTRNTTASTARRPVRKAMFNTVSSFIRLSLNNVDESGLSTDFKTCEVMLRNNVAGERVLGTLGAKYINFGIFQMSINSTVLFTDPTVVAAIRNNTLIAFKMGMKNGDGGFMMDIPSATLESGNKNFPVNASVQLQCPIKPVLDATYGYVVSFSLFPFLP